MKNEAWAIHEKNLNIQDLAKNESVFAVGNGYVGVRGYFEEGYGTHNSSSVRGTYINGFYDTNEIVYGEDHYGNPHDMQMMLSIPDGLQTKIVVDGEEVNPFHQEVENYVRELRLQKGYLFRSYTWCAKDGARFTFTFKRMASFSIKEIVALQIEVTAHDRAGRVEVVSCINGKSQNVVEENDPRVNAHVKERQLRTVDMRVEENVAVIKQQTKNTNFFFSLLATDTLSKENHEKNVAVDEATEQIVTLHDVVVEVGETVAYNKYICYMTNLACQQDLEATGKALLQEATDMGFGVLLEKQEAYVADFWKTSDIEIDGDEGSQQSIRFSLYQLLQSVGKTDFTNIAAKGLTGEGYGGHYFWDTETYIFPFFLYTQPEIAKSLLEYRYGILNGARARATEMGFKGALFPWRTINGEECSAYYPAGTAQIHINADIMYALQQYYHATGDEAFLQEKGLEMLVETTRFYVDYGDWIKGKGFCINGVTGPDEYTALINNNTYTNMMVKNQIQFLLQVMDETTKETFSITEAEWTEWKEIVGKIYVHRMEDSHLIGQDDTFFGKAPWNFEQTPKEKYPLLLHFHPMVIYKHQVLKQADLLLSMVLLPNEFSQEEKVANYRYYEPLTTHDSSLSYCMHSILAQEVGLEEDAKAYFQETIRLDLDDTHHNTRHGLHMACMGGSWLNIVFGFGGMRVIDGSVTFAPSLPEGWNKIAFTIQYKGSVVKVTVTKEATTYTLVEGQPLEIVHNGEAKVIQ